MSYHCTRLKNTPVATKILVSILVLGRESTLSFDDRGRV